MSHVLSETQSESETKWRAPGGGENEPQAKEKKEKVYQKKGKCMKNENGLQVNRAPDDKGGKKGSEKQGRTVTRVIPPQSAWNFA